MSNVIRLSKKQIELLEQYRSIMIESDEIVKKRYPEGFFPSFYKSAEYNELVTFAISTAIHYAEKNLQDMK